MPPGSRTDITSLQRFMISGITNPGPFLCSLSGQSSTTIFILLVNASGYYYQGLLHGDRADLHNGGIFLDSDTNLH